MAYEQKPDSGSIFVNDKKTQPAHPDRKGSALVGGVEYWVSGWIKKAKSGQQYLSISFKRKDAGKACRPQGLSILRGRNWQ